jgi:hypothetical protein
MKHENYELSADVNKALAKIDFSTNQNQNREYVKEMHVISKHQN